MHEQVKKARDLRKKTDLVAFQLTKMHDRLPPLSVYNRKFKLDEWQVGCLSSVLSSLASSFFILLFLK